MVDRFCQPFSSNTSRNKGVLHALATCASGRFADNLCARRPPTDTHITCVAIPDSRCLGLRKLEVPEPRHGQVLGRLKNLTKTSLGCRAPQSVALMQCSKRSSRGSQRSVKTRHDDEGSTPRAARLGLGLSWFASPKRPPARSGHTSGAATSTPSTRPEPRRCAHC